MLPYLFFFKIVKKATSASLKLDFKFLSPYHLGLGILKGKDQQRMCNVASCLHNINDSIFLGRSGVLEFYATG
jgi:hypothetical protein